MNNNLPKDPKYFELETELSERIVYLAAFLDACLGEGNDQYGQRLLAPLPGKKIDIYFEDFEQGSPLDLDKYKIGRNLPFFYEYAYHARCVQGIDWDDWDIDNSDQLFREFLQLTDSFAVTSSTSNRFPQWGIACSLAKGEEWRKSGLWEMMELCDARHRLDFENSICVSDIAILANMNEKSVRNALRAEGEHKLQSLDGENVESEEAKRWLKSRKTGFRETTFVNFDTDSRPETLGYMEIAPFIRSRLDKLYDHKWRWDKESESIGQSFGYTLDQIWSIANNIEKFPIKDTRKIAKMIKVDPVWFTEQVFTAFFPEQMEMILYKDEIQFESVINDKENPVIEISLTEKGIKNGYIDIPAKFTDFFPKDCFGDRATNTQGIPIELRFGSEVRSTDIRVKSSVTISPRARFGNYLNKELQAKSGDKIFITKVDERVYEIRFVSGG